METIHIYHTNDLHSHLENWPRISKFLLTEKNKHGQAGEDIFLFDIGDFIDRWHPLSEATRGKGNIALLNECQFHAATIGNNEGVNLPHEDLDRLYDDAHFDLLAANLYLPNGAFPSWVKPYKIYQTKEGTRIGVIGLTAQFKQLYEQLGWQVTEPIAELAKWLPQVRKESDIVLLLSHLGIRDDEEIAATFPEVDIILGAHTHHLFETGKQIGSTLLGAAGKYGYYVGKVTLTVNQNKDIIEKTGIVYDVKNLPAPDNEQQIIDHFFREGKNLLGDKVAELFTPLINDPFRETELSILLCQALREWCQADCAMLNAGLLLGPLEGTVTEFDLLTICPHPINPCVVEVTGAELREILIESRDKQLHQRVIKGLGFRGTVLGVFIYDGIGFETDTIYIQNNPIDQNRTYSLALPDMFTFGHFFKNVIPNKAKQYFLPEFLRDILKWRLQK